MTVPIHIRLLLINRPIFRDSIVQLAYMTADTGEHNNIAGCLTYRHSPQLKVKVIYMNTYREREIVVSTHLCTDVYEGDEPR